MSETTGMEQLLRAAVQSGAQSLLIKAGDVFRARIDGELVRLSEKPFTPEDTRRIALQLLPDETARNRIDELTDRDFAWDMEDLARFRVNILRQRNTLAVVMRVIPWDIPNVEGLNLPTVLRDLADLENGLILVTGSTGSGKSTTQAAMVGWINENRKKHIITLEDPIEFRHRNADGTVTQREVGRDTNTFRSGLRTALRQDPDVILIGEMRDPETLAIALEAAETGQLVISTFHASTALGTLSRMMAMFPADDEEVASILRRELQEPGDKRIWYLAEAFRRGWSVDQVFEHTWIDRWWLVQIEDLVREEAGLRDAAALAEVVTLAHRRGEDIGTADVLARYARWRRADTAQLAVATDALNRLFSSDNPVLRLGRDLGLGAVNAAPMLRRAFMREAAGLTGDLPRLLAGTPL